MPSSTFSSESAGSESTRPEPAFGARRWAWAWLGALALACALLAGWEFYWRAQGVAPEAIDSQQLWALQRDRADAAKPRPVVFLGASRTVYGIDPKVWRERLPQHKPLMLAINGHYPLATLRDLALDEDFNGLVICDVDSYGLLPAYWDMQQPWLDYRATRWNANWFIHRVLLTRWQRSSVLANPAIGLWTVLKRVWSGRSLELPYSRNFANRAGEMLFDRVDTAKLAAHFDSEVDPKIALFPAPSPATFLADLQPVEDWVARLRARGGDVVFVTMPVAGRLPEMETRYMPRALYWDAFAQRPHIHALHYADVPALGAIPLPDHSHVRAEDRRTLTLALIDALQARGWLEDLTGTAAGVHAEPAD